MTTTAIGAGVNPYPGLRPFHAGEDHLFFGREGQLDDLLGRLRRTRFVAVVGTSGSGKSSLVQAGLLPALYGGFMAGSGSHWRVASMRPGIAPIANLAAALTAPSALGGTDAEHETARARAVLERGALGVLDLVKRAGLGPGERVLIVVDQFEELFRFAHSAGGERANEAAAFVKLLLAASSSPYLPIYVVLTMRSDFLGDCAQFRDLPETINDGLFLVPRMTRDELRRAIEGPAGVAATPIAARLATRLLNELGEDPDQLPVLQHALMRTWTIWCEDHGRGEPLDVRHLEAAGGLSEALSRHADEIYDALPDARARAVAERLFRALTELAPDNRGIRRPTRFGEACAIAGCDAAELTAVVEAFRAPGRSFLTPPAGTPLDDDTVLDVSHESLMRAWGRLQTWVAEEARSARTYRRLAQAAALHLRGQAALWRDPDLSIALAWREENAPNAAWARRYDPAFEGAMRFLDASEAARDTELEQRARVRRRQVQSLRAFAAVLGVLFVSAAVAAWWGNVQRAAAQREARAATVAALGAGVARRRADELALNEHRAAQAALVAKVRAQRAVRSERVAENAAMSAARGAQAAKLAAQRSAANGEYDAGLAFLARGEYAAARKPLDLAIAGYGATGDRAHEAAALAARGQTAALRQNYPGALADDARALQLDPANVDAYVDRSLTYDALGDSARALADADAALRIRPTAAAYVARGHALADAAQPRYADALDDYGHALALADTASRSNDEATADRAKMDAANAHVGRALALIARRDDGAAVAETDAALRANPVDPQAYVARAQAEAAERNYPEALIASYRALTLEPNDPDARRVLAFARAGASLPAERVAHAAAPSAAPFAQRTVALAPSAPPKPAPRPRAGSAPPPQTTLPVALVAAASPADACAQALGYEQQAAQGNIPRQEAYDMALIGLRANEDCTDADRHLVNQAYLLSQRAPAEHDLQIGDWRADLREANALLERCTTTRGLAGTHAAEDCRTQERYNDRFAGAYPAANNLSLQSTR